MSKTKTIFQHLIDLIYPLDIPNFEDSQGFSFTKDLESLCIDNIWVANSLDSNQIKDAIVRIKDGGEFALTQYLTTKFVEQIITFGLNTSSRKEFEDPESKSLYEMFARLFDPNTKTLLTFVPPDRARLIKRGFHLPELIAKELHHKLNLAANGKKIYDLESVFIKSKKTRRQTGLDREQRLVNLKGKIELQIIPPIQDLAGNDWNTVLHLQDNLSIFIIDDVCTTGATINECAIQIKSQFPKLKVYGLAVASNL
jgi:predicted amidophosphoribosyltransferase